MRAIDHTEDIVAIDEAKPCMRTLQIVDRLSHITLGTEDQCSNSIVTVLHLFCLTDLI